MDGRTRGKMRSYSDAVILPPPEQPLGIRLDLRVVIEKLVGLGPLADALVHQPGGCPGLGLPAHAGEGLVNARVHGHFRGIPAEESLHGSHPCSPRFPVWSVHPSIFPGDGGWMDGQGALRRLPDVLQDSHLISLLAALVAVFGKVAKFGAFQPMLPALSGKPSSSRHSPKR